MGLNSYFAYGVCVKLGLSWRVALACSCLSGLLMAAMSATGLCTAVQQRAPASIKKGITVGIGLMQALIGFEIMRVVVPGRDTLLALGPPCADQAVGVLSVALLVGLLALRVKGAFLIAMAAATVLSWIVGAAPAPKALLGAPSLSGSLLQLDWPGFVSHWRDTVPATLVLLCVSVLDTAGVHHALGHQAGLLRNGRLPGTGAAFAAASAGTVLGAAMGTSPVIIHNESCAGIEAGARTGLAAVTTAVLFLMSLPLTPLLAAVPPAASAGPLVIVGMLMLSATKHIRWERIEEAFPAMLTLCLIPLTYSLITGIVAGAVTHVALSFLVTPESRPDLGDLSPVSTEITRKSRCIEEEQKEVDIMEEPMLYGASSI
jgi:AGZA family xanthine/uracil permease-like MFS transporter